MAKISLSQQFQNNIASIAEVQSIGKMKRSKNKRGNMEYSAEVVFKGHENNSFQVSWDTKADDYMVYRSEIARNNGFITHRTEIFNKEYYRYGLLGEVSEFIKDTWDKQNPNW